MNGIGFKNYLLVVLGLLVVIMFGWFVAVYLDWTLCLAAFLGSFLVSLALTPKH